MRDPAHEIAEATRLARRAAALGRDDAVALCTAGFGLAYVSGELDDGTALIDRALALNPNLAWAWYFSGWTKLWLGEPDEAIERESRAMRLSPQDPHIFNMQSATAYAHFMAGRYAEAISWAEAAIREHADHMSALRVLSASCAMLGRLEQAQKVVMRIGELDPALRISNLPQVMVFRRPEDMAHLAEGLRRAGLPE